MTKKPTDKKGDSKKKVNEAEAAAAAIAGIKSVEAPDKKKATKEKPQVDIKHKDFEGYVALMLVKQALEGVEKQLNREIRDGEVFAHFADEIARTGSQPEAFEGNQGRCSAQFQYKQRGFGFSKEVADALDENGVEFDKIAKVQEQYLINPEIVADKEKFGKLVMAINALGFGDVLRHQAPSFTYKFNKTTIKQLSVLKDRSIRSDLALSIAQLSAGKPMIDGIEKEGALESALAILQEQGILSLDNSSDDDDEDK